MDTDTDTDTDNYKAQKQINLGVRLHTIHAC